MNREEGWYTCDVCDVLGIGDECWLCGSSDLYRGPGCKWPGSAGRRGEDRPYLGGHSYVEHGNALHGDEPDVTWEMILQDIGEPPSPHARSI